MNEALKLGLTNGAVMHEIVLSWLELGCHSTVYEALNATIKVKSASSDVSKQR